MPKTVGGNRSGTVLKELELPNTFYAGPATGNKDLPLFRPLSFQDINQSIADGVGGKMTYVGSNSIAANMTVAGGNAIASKMDVTGANLIASSLGHEGAYTLGQKLRVSKSNGTARLTYTQLAGLVDNNKKDL